MEYVVFLIFGIIDMFLVLAFIFKIFRWPLGSYLKECIMIAVLCSIESFINRFIVHLPEYDNLAQMVIVMLCFQFLMRVNFYHALTLSIIGALAYSELVYFVYQILERTKFVSSADLASSAGSGIFIIQLISEILGAIIVWLIYKLNLGFSFVAVPPHDRKTKFTAAEKLNMTIDFIAAIGVFTLTYWLITFGGFGINVVMATEFIALVILLYLARKRDYS